MLFGSTAVAGKMLIAVVFAIAGTAIFLTLVQRHRVTVLVVPPPIMGALAGHPLTVRASSRQPHLRFRVEVVVLATTLPR